MIELTDGDADYRHFRRFDYPPGKEPTYLKTEYGINSKGGANVGKIVGEDFELADSSLVLGIQVADLLASGVRRLMRVRFDDIERAAALMGANMLEALREQQPIQLITLGGPSSPVTKRSAEPLQIIAQHCKPLLRQQPPPGSATA